MQLKKIIFLTTSLVLATSAGLASATNVANAKHRRYHYRTHKVYRRHAHALRHTKRAKLTVRHHKARYTFHKTAKRHAKRVTVKHVYKKHKFHARRLHTTSAIKQYKIHTHSTDIFKMPKDYTYMNTDAQQAKQQRICSNTLAQDINNERTANGLQPLAIWTDLDNIAAERSEQLASNFSHYNSDGNLAADEDGYDMGYNNNPSDHKYGENIMEDGEDETDDQGRTIDYSGKYTAYDVNDQFMNHDQDCNNGHRDNILNPRYRGMGIGTYYDTGNNGQTPGYFIAEEFQ